MTSITLTPQHPGPFQSLLRISYYFSKRGQSLLQAFTPSKYPLIAWKLIFREGVVLRLGTPYSVLTDLVVLPFFLYLIRLTYDKPRCLYASLFFSHHAACIPHFIHLRAVHGYALLLSFHSANAVRLPHALLPFHSMAVLDAHFYLMPLESGIF